MHLAEHGEVDIALGVDYVTAYAGIGGAVGFRLGADVAGHVRKIELVHQLYARAVDDYADLILRAQTDLHGLYVGGYLLV